MINKVNKLCIINICIIKENYNDIDFMVFIKFYIICNLF